MYAWRTSIHLHVWVVLTTPPQAQYIFVYDAILEGTTSRGTEIPVEGLPSRMKELELLDSEGETGYRVEFNVRVWRTVVKWIHVWYKDWFLVRTHCLNSLFAEVASVQSEHQGVHWCQWQCQPAQEQTDQCSSMWAMHDTQCAVH